MYIYSFEGDTVQYMTDSKRKIPAGAIRMKTTRPEGNYVASVNGEWVLSLEQVVKKFDELIDDYLESFARQLYSKGLANAITYIGCGNPVWEMEAEYLQHMRTEVLSKAYTIMEELLPQVQAGKRTIPTWEELKSMLPVLKWPEGSRGFHG